MLVREPADQHRGAARRVYGPEVAGASFAVPPSGEARAMLARWQQEPDIRDALIQSNRIYVVLRNRDDAPQRC